MKRPEILQNCEVIIGNANKRFSGVTSTMLQTLAHQKKCVSLCVLGKHHLPEDSASLVVSFSDLARGLKQPLVDGRYRVFHARRNDEMIQALLLKHVFGAKIRILFTSTAQRHHSKFTRWLMSHMDAVISTCQAAANYLKTPPLTLVPHGIDTNIYFPDTEPNTADEIHVGMFGRVRAQKGCDILVKAAIAVLPNHSNVSVTIVGAIAPDQRDFVEDLKKQVHAAGLQQRITFTGELSFDKIPPLFRSMDLVCALSLNEGFGLTVLEAMSSGAAVLASEAGAWPDIVKPGVHGALVPTADLDATTRALDTLLSDKAKLESMGQAGRETVLKHYKIEQEAAKLCEIYRQLQGGENSPYKLT